jgi:hypothetical protein
MGSFVLINDVNMTYLAHKYGFGPHPMNKFLPIISLIRVCRGRLECLKPANDRRYEGDLKICGIVTKNVFKIFVQV